MIESPESLLEILNRLREEDKLDEVASSHLNKDESLTFWTFCESLAILGIHAPSEITRATFEQHVAGNTRTWCSSAKRENFVHFTFSCSYHVTQITRISLTHTARKSLENQRSNAHSVMTNT